LLEHSLKATCWASKARREEVFNLATRWGSLTTLRWSLGSIFPIHRRRDNSKPRVWDAFSISIVSPPLAGSWRELRDDRGVTDCDVGHHGEINFYTSEGTRAGGTWKWHKYFTRFTNGKLDHIIKVLDYGQDWKREGCALFKRL
jgi:hypothetical protein